jgi:hypothetical protein
VAGCPPDWQKRAVGSFAGKVGQTIQGARPLDAVQTMFILDGAGMLQGAYVDQEPQRKNPGTLELIVFEPCRATFRWKDLYGTGVARFVFAVDGKSFKGGYGAADQADIEKVTVWTGRRE